jgi:hypothetical protein
MERRYHSDPATGDFFLLEWKDDRWFPAMQTMTDWQRGDIRIYRPIDIPDTLVTMPNCLYWPRLNPREEKQPRVMLSLPWIQEKHIQYISYDSPIDVNDTATVEVPTATPFAYPAHIIDAVLEHAQATKKSCPITMEPIEKATATVTACGHIFQKAAIIEWLKTHQTCPECRQTFSA